MANKKPNASDVEKAKRRMEFMERAANSRGIQATKTEPTENGGVYNFVDDVSPYLELYWAHDVGTDGKASAELCLWFMDNPEREYSYCFYVLYYPDIDTWEFGYEKSADSLHESSKAKRLAQEAFGFEEPGFRDVDEPSALAIINALCAGFASTIPKKDKDS
ncbi:hypothetical protein HZC53_01640 [Candidatus Uhrbacteria bacterium]|nr:hypothetical protein [Candidatus Uhrbacteria bacterium]